MTATITPLFPALVPCDGCHGTGFMWAGTGEEMEQVRVTCLACRGEGMVEAGEEPRDLEGDTSAHDQPYLGQRAA